MHSKYLISKKTVAGGVALIDILGFTELKLRQNDKLWLDIVQPFYYLIEKIESNKSIRLNTKILGDGVLFSCDQIEPIDWFNFCKKEIYTEVLEWQNQILPIEKCSFSAIFGYANYNKFQQNDVLGKNIDELFLIEHYGIVDRFLLTESFSKLLQKNKKNNIKIKLHKTLPISYLKAKEIEYNEVIFD